MARLLNSPPWASGSAQSPWTASSPWQAVTAAAPSPFHRMLLNGELPLTMGAASASPEVSMLLLGKAHIGEVQSSLWDPDTVRACEQAGVVLL